MAVIVGGNETGLLNTSFAFSNRNDRTSQGDAGHGEQLYVNASNGNLVIQHQDVFLPSLGDDFVLARTYNARGRIDDPAKPNDGEWRFSTNIRLYVKYSGAQKYFEVEFGDGSIFDYRINPSTGLYVSTDGAGAFETIADLGSGNPPFVLTRSDGSTLNFDAQGRLTSMLDTNGVRISYVYSGDQLTQILDDTGHVLTYTYQGGLLSKVTDESQVVLVEYKYANGRLSEVIDRAGERGRKK